MRLLCTAAVAASLASVSAIAGAQSESALRAAFEGKIITVKIDMPATAYGVEVFPLESTPVNWRQVADRSKDYGTALKIGTQVMVTKMVVKKDHIEFQLGGGGYGTFGDETGKAAYASEASESKEERALRDSVKKESNATKKKAYEKELNNLRSARERENARGRAEAAQANELREANLRAKRVVSGSRFNVWYKPTVPPDAMTPEGVMQALKPYVDFSGAGIANAATDSPMSASSATKLLTGANALMSIKKGLLLADVELLLGPANTASESKEGVLTLMKRNYVYDGKKISASFVNGVLIDYAIAPQ